MCNDPTEQPTQQLRIPGYLWADQEEWEQGKLRPRKQEESMLAWQPIVIFLAILVPYAVLGCFLASHVSQALYVLLMWSK